MQTEIKHLCEKAILMAVDHVEDGFISSVFVRERKDKNKFWMILNVKKFNKHVAKHRF